MGKRQLRRRGRCSAHSRLTSLCAGRPPPPRAGNLASVERSSTIREGASSPPTMARQCPARSSSSKIKVRRQVYAPGREKKKGTGIAMVLLLGARAANAGRSILPLRSLRLWGRRTEAGRPPLLRDPRRRSRRSFDQPGRGHQLPLWEAAATSLPMAARTPLPTSGRSPPSPRHRRRRLRG